MRRFRLFIFLLPVVLNNYGCGLENITYLSPPGNPTLASPTYTTFTINSTSKNDEAEFLGFELYYKFYTTSFSIPSVEDVDDLKSYGFLPVCSSSDTASGTYVNHTQPLFEVPAVDRGKTFAITVTFTNPTTVPGSDSQPALVYNGTPLTFSIRRDFGDADYGSNSYLQGKPFVQRIPHVADAYKATDSDVTSVYSASIVSLLMYAMSYGKENITTDLYSPPVYLGYINILIHQ